MNNTIKSAYSKIQASDEFKHSTAELLQDRNNKRSVKFVEWKKPFLAIVASLAVVIGIAAAFPYLFHNSSVGPNRDNSLASGNGIVIPKIVLPKSGKTATADMIGLIVYQGKVYTMSDTKIDVDTAKSLMGQKIGTAKGNIDEWSKQDEYAKELASNFTGDVYTVKGYDSGFRILGYHINPDHSAFVELFDCLNGITVSSGNDIFGKLKMQGNVVRMTYVQWNNGETPIDTIKDATLVNAFINALHDTTPCKLDLTSDPVLNWSNKSVFRNVQVKLKDGCVVELILIQGGYVRYSNCEVTFKMENGVFQQLWNQLDLTKDPSVKSK